MFDKIDMNNLGGMLGELQKKAEEIQDSSADKIYSAKSGGGMIEIKANGKGEVLDLEIDDSLLEDKESLQILLISAMNDVLKNIENGKKDMAMSMLGGLNPFANK